MNTLRQLRGRRARTIAAIAAALLAAVLIAGCAVVGIGNNGSSQHPSSDDTPHHGTPGHGGSGSTTAPSTAAPGGPSTSSTTHPTTSTTAANTSTTSSSTTSTTAPPVDDEDAHIDFVITGAVIGRLAPGVERVVDVTFTNPYKHAIEIETLEITIADATTRDGRPNPACKGTTNLAVSRSLRGDVVIPAGASHSLQTLGLPQSQWPTVTMRNLSVNQDACKHTSFTLNFDGTARKA